MKTMWAMLGALLVSIIVMELGMVFVTYDKVHAVLDEALDAAIVKGTKEEDLKYGKVYIDSSAATLAARTLVKHNLKLNGSWENNILKNTNLTLTINQDPDHGQRPYISGKFNCKVKAMSPRLFGEEGYDITVERTQFYVSEYK